MPKPIPPPPPQPSLEETVAAVRLIRRLMVVFIGLFLLLASRYQADAWMVSYGREDGQSWLLWKARNLDEGELRAHDGGRIVWLIGNSVMRDAFHERDLNQRLAAAQSPWRVAKFAVTRGAAGLGAGMLDELPIRSGDRIVVPVAIDNFYRDWIHRVEFPIDRIARMLSVQEILSIEEYSWQEKLEYAVGVPHNFYRHQQPYMAGQLSWFVSLWWMEWPSLERPSQAFRPRRMDSADWVERRREEGWDRREPITAEALDWRSTQFHAAGIAKFRAYAEANDVSLHLIDIPFRQEYQAVLVEDEAREMWDNWREMQPELSYFPQLEEDHYYDLRHPNSRGRDVLMDHIFAWMVDTPRGEPTPLTWTPESQ